MEKMFAHCALLEKLDVSNFKTNNVEIMQEMFSGCSSLNSIDISNFNTNKLENSFYMFNGCKMKLRNKLVDLFDKFGDGFLDDF